MSVQMDAAAAQPHVARSGIRHGGLLALGLILVASAFLYAGWLDYVPATLGRSS